MGRCGQARGQTRTKPVPMKQVPTPGRFEMEVTSGEHKRSYAHPSKAISEIARAIGRAKRAKEGEAPAFEAAITLNDQLFTFNDPEAALEACKAMTAAMRDLPKLKMGLGDLGEIPLMKPEDAQAAIARPASRRQIQSRRDDGSPPPDSNGFAKANAGQRPQSPAPHAQPAEHAAHDRPGNPKSPEGRLIAHQRDRRRLGGDPIEAKKEAIVQSLAFALSQADSTGKADGKPKTGKPGERKPAETTTPKAEN